MEIWGKITEQVLAPKKYSTGCWTDVGHQGHAIQLKQRINFFNGKEISVGIPLQEVSVFDSILSICPALTNVMMEHASKDYGGIHSSARS